MSALGHRAIVMGSGIAGLLAARVLSPHFAEVVVFERDDEAATPGPRGGVMQGRQLHTLLASGLEVMERLMPGLERELLSRGAIRSPDVGLTARAFKFGSWTIAGAIDVAMITMTRPLLESCVRERVSAIPNVVFRYGEAVEEVVYDRVEGRVTGVDSSPVGVAPGVEPLPAALVVDARGRGAPVAQMFKAWGAEPPDEETLGLNVGYSTVIVKKPAGFSADWFSVLLASTPPDSPAGMMHPIEDDQWIMAFCGRGAAKPPAGWEPLLDYAGRLPQPTIRDCMRLSTPVGEPKVYNFLAAVRRRFDRARFHPNGLLVVGDAVCSFNPLYGQGMSIAALEAGILEGLLAGANEEASEWREALWRGFYAQIAPILDKAWGQSFALDGLYPETKVRRGPGFALRKAAFLWAQKLSITEPVLRRRMMRTAQLLPEAPIGLGDLAASQWRLWRGRGSRVSPATFQAPGEALGGASSAPGPARQEYAVGL
jgi:2-polyprenyl-6-methoxyphenol hydroxylase-like FAD-dependent oxidoreductase